MDKIDKTVNRKSNGGLSKNTDAKDLEFKNLSESSSENRTVVIVEDEKAVRHLVKIALEKNNYQVLEATSAKELFDLMSVHSVDMILLDLFLEDEHGVDVCRTLRQQTSAPIIIISSMKGELNIVMGLEAGADMYLEKPFSVPILLSSVNALFRRVKLDHAEDELVDVSVEEDVISQQIERIKTGTGRHYDQDYTVRLNSWTFIPRLSCLKHDSGRNAKLTKNELALLNLFIQHNNQILDRDDIARALKVGLAADSSRVVDVQVSRLRTKLKDKNTPNIIKSIRNKGYILNGIAKVSSSYKSLVK